MKTIRYDKAFINYDKKDSWEILNGDRLRVPITITRTGIFTYYENGQLIKELRSDAEVLKQSSLDTLKGAYFTNNHPPVMVNETNYTEYAVGTIGDVITTRKDETTGITYIDSFVTITNRQTKTDLLSGKKIEVSAGYFTDVIKKDGIAFGESYQREQTNIDYNHVSLVDSGRAGNEVKIRFDNQDVVILSECDMLEIGEGIKNDKEPENLNKNKELFKMIIKGKEVTLDALGETLVKQVFDEKDSEITSLKSKADKLDSLEAKLLSTEKELKDLKEGEAQRFKERSDTYTKALNYVSKEKLDSCISTLDMQKEAVKIFYKDSDLSGHSDGFFPEAFKLLKNQPVINQPARVDSRDFTGNNGGAKPLATREDALIQRLEDAYKKADEMLKPKIGN